MTSSFPPQNPDALLVLNSPLGLFGETKYANLLRSWWKAAPLIVCADGGANRLYKEADGDDQYIPNIITGDLDSVKETVLNYYRAKNVTIVKNPCQDTNDMHKGLQCISQELYERGRGADNHAPIVVILGALGGRFDQEMANINCMYSFHGLHIYAVNPIDIVFLAKEGSHSFKMDGKWMGKKCGLLPVGGPVERASTSGFKWDLDDTQLAFGGLVSSSNEWKPDREEQTLTTSDPLLVSVVFKKD